MNIVGKGAPFEEYTDNLTKWKEQLGTKVEYVTSKEGPVELSLNFGATINRYAFGYFYYKDGKKAYSICCNNRFKNDFCNYKCSECKNKAYLSYNEDRLLEHFKGIKSYGIYPLLEDNTCYFIVLDLIIKIMNLKKQKMLFKH